jgi:hypothetical protein
MIPATAAAGLKKYSNQHSLQKIDFGELGFNARALHFGQYMNVLGIDIFYRFLLVSIYPSG